MDNNNHHVNNMGESTTSMEKPKLFKRVSSSVQNFKNVPDNFDPFDPKLRIDAAGSITAYEAFAHLMKGSLGTGILAMSHGFTFVGTALGFIGTLLIISTLGHSVHLILQCQYFQCKRWGTPYIEYPDCMEDAFKNGPPICRKLAPAMPYVVDFFMLVYQLGTCSCYFIFIAYNIAQVADMYGFHLDSRVWMTLILVPIMLMNLIRDLHYLAPVSTAGNFIFFLAMVVIYYYFFGYDGSAFDHAAERPLVVWPPTRWPLFIGTACFALESIAIVVKIEHHMKEPKKFRQPLGVFNIGIFITAMLFATTGMLGYMKYGQDAQSSITLNIASDQKLAQVVKVLYALVVFFSYPLQNFVPLELLWVNYIKQHMTQYSEKKKMIVEYVFREVIVLITWAFAMVIPHLDLLISLFGAFCLASLGMIFPAVIHILVLRHERIGFGFLNWVLFKDILLISFGVFTMVSGTIISMMDIFAAIESDMHPAATNVTTHAVL
uniref:Proton-coupled amino acid transporter 4 n=2 Tax=Cacopsylla melanoneura TaxID=428564 RepID=A0A8D8UQ44_9HEMI